MSVRNKKYLLYIHDEQFALEPQKSGLVNVLLDKHYGKPPMSIRAKSLEISKERTDSTPEVAAFVMDDQGIVSFKNLKPRGKQCKNGHSIPEGRSKCMGKGCQYGS